MTKKKPQTDFKPIGVKDLTDILGITIKKDEANKVVTFLCQLSAYTENAQFNVSYNAPSSTGKSYIPTEIASLLPWNGWRRFGPSVPLGGEGGVRTHVGCLGPIRFRVDAVMATSVPLRTSLQQPLKF